MSQIAKVHTTLGAYASNWNVGATVVATRLMDEGVNTFFTGVFGPISWFPYFTVKLGPIARPIPDVPLGYYVRLYYEYYSDTPGSGAHSLSIDASLYEGRKHIETIHSVETDDSGIRRNVLFYFTAAGLANVTDWDNLTLRVLFNIGIVDGSGLEVLVDYVELVTPDSAIVEAGSYALNDSLPLPVAMTFTAPAAAGASAIVASPLYLQSFQAPASEATAHDWLSVLGYSMDAESGGGATAVPIADSAIGADATTVTATVPLTDFAVGSEILGVSALQSLSDSAAGADAVATTAVLSTSDPAAGSDAVTLAATNAVADAALGYEAIIVDIGYSMGGPAVGSETITLTAFGQATEAGVGVDTLSTRADISISDSGLGQAAIGADDIALHAYVDLNDPAQGADSLAVAIGTTSPGGVSPGGGPSHSGRWFDPSKIFRHKEPDTTDKAEGHTVISIEAFLAAKDEASGSESFTVVKQYPQLEAFTLLLAA